MVIAAFVISVVALVVAIMALPTVMQMIWGKPRLTGKFNHKDLEKGRVMECALYNYPIIAGFAKTIGVRRMPIEDLMVSYSITEYATNRVIHPGSVPHILKYDGETNAQRVSLAASAFPAYFAIVSVDYATKKVEVFDGGNSLPIGKYTVKVNASFQENTTDIIGTSVINNEYPYAYWVS